MFDFSELPMCVCACRCVRLCVCVCLEGLHVVEMVQRCKSLWFGIFPGPQLSSAQLLRILRGGLRVHGKVAAPFGMAFPGSAQQSADTAGAVSSHASPNALYCQEHNMKSVHAPLTGGGGGELLVLFQSHCSNILRDYGKCMNAIWAPVKVNSRQEFCSLILLLMSCAFTPIQG